jgi:hypothetical protein
MGEPLGYGLKRLTNMRGGNTVILLLPARTDTKWFHNYCIEHEIEFLKGRLKFGNAINSAPFPSMIVKMLNLQETF